MIAGVAVLAASAAFGIGSITMAGAQAPATTSTIALGVGANASQRVVSWYASANTAQSVQVAPASQLINGEFPASAVTYPATVAANTVNGGFNRHAAIHGPPENTPHSHRVGGPGARGSAYTLQNQSFTG